MLQLTRALAYVQLFIKLNENVCCKDIHRHAMRRIHYNKSFLRLFSLAMFYAQFGNLHKLGRLKPMKTQLHACILAFFELCFGYCCKVAILYINGVLVKITSVIV